MEPIKTVIKLERKPVLKLSAELLKQAGITYPAKRAVKAVVDEIRLSGGFVPEGASDECMALIATVGNQTKAMDNAKRTIAIAVALMEESGEYEKLIGPNGKPFKSAKHLFMSAYPSLSDSTARNYLDVGRTLYLPEIRGELSPELKVLAQQEPGNAQAALSTLKKPEERKALEAELRNVKPDSKGRIPAKVLKEAVAAAKEKAGSPARRNKSDGATDSQSAKAKQEEQAVALRVALKQAMAPDYLDNELHYLIAEERVARYLNTLKEACKDGEAALRFCRALYEISRK